MQIETQGFLPQIPEEQPEQVNITDVGIAVDVGTTTVAVKIWSLSSKKCLSVIAEKNLQSRYGCDIIRRISFATRPPLTGSSAVVETGESALHYAIISQLERMFAHALALAAQKTMRGIQLNVSKIVITGNTTMLSFVCAFPVEGLAAAPFTPVSHFGFTASWDKVRSGKINEKCSNLDLPTPEILQLFAASSVDSDTPVYFPPCVGAFIGADTVCAMLSAGFPSPESNENSCWDTPVQTPLLLADIGTNTEIALFIPKTEEQPAKEEVVVNAGVHSITVSANGFEKQTVNYAFAGEDFFTVKTTLRPLVMGNLELCLKKMAKGVFYFNALDSSPVDEENSFAASTVNGRPILGIFENSEGESAFIYISEKLAQDGNILSVNAKPYDREKHIDRQRRRMYTAYSVLICSLVPTFFTVGNFTAVNNSYAAGRANFDEVKKWQKYSYYSIGVSCTAGAWFAFEMVRYLFAANEVLPARAVQKK